MSQHLSARIAALAPTLCRTFQNKAALRPIPAPRGSIATAGDFLKRIGRSADTKLTVESWDDLWKFDGPQLKKLGLAVRDRRYIMWSLEKYRQGEDPAEFAHPPKPKKKIRGWGPAVQNGKRIRSRRHR